MARKKRIEFQKLEYILWLSSLEKWNGGSFFLDLFRQFLGQCQKVTQAERFLIIDSVVFWIFNENQIVDITYEMYIKRGQTK